MPPIPLLLNITHFIPVLLTAFTRHFIYSVWLAPVNPGKIITIGDVGHEFSSAQSKAISPPSDRVSISLNVKTDISNKFTFMNYG